MAIQHIDTKDAVKREILKQINAKMIHVDLQSDLFDNITFPSLPKNFQMLMSNIDYPDKSKQNPNGTLFMKPQDIDHNSADDIALQCFGGDFSANNKSKLKMTMNPTAESMGQYFANNMYNYILNSLYEDTVNMKGKDLIPQDIKAHNDRMVTMSSNIINAITTYVDRSISVIVPIIQMVAGNQNINYVKKTIQTANRASWRKITSWLDSQSSIEKDIGRHDKDAEYRELDKKRKIQEIGGNVFKCVVISNIPYSDKNAYLIKISNDLMTQTTEAGLDTIIKQYILNMSYKNFINEWNKHGEKPYTLTLKKGIDLSESYDFERQMLDKLFEDDSDEQPVLSTLSPNYDEIFNDLTNQISMSISETIGPRDEWKCIKDVAAQMKILKDRADEEIKKKIELVCKTGGQKSLVHHPFKAEGLLTMWNRYSSELQVRIDNRIAQLTGSSGSVETGSANMVEDFLRVTYPRIIAVLLTYRCIFSQIAYEYKNGYIPNYSYDDVSLLMTTEEERLTQMVGNVVTTFDSINS